MVQLKAIRVPRKFKEKRGNDLLANGSVELVKQKNMAVVSMAPIS